MQDSRVVRIERIGDATLIYALCEYPSWIVRYVGKTTQHLHQRHKAHIRDAKRGSKRPVHYWIRKQMRNKNRLAIWLLDIVPKDGDWAACEKLWIKKYRIDNSKSLLNMTDGGEGLAGHKFTKEHAEKIGDALRKGKTHLCDECGTGFHRKPNAATSKHLFCSKICYQMWQKGKPKDNSSGLMGVAGRSAAIKAKARRRGNG